MLGYPDAMGPLHWSKKRFENILQHRQAALVAARKSWADFLLVCNITFVNMTKKVKFSLTHYRALGPELILVYRQLAGDFLSHTRQ